jgi:hypothetical protein
MPQDKKGGESNPIDELQYAVADMDNRLGDVHNRLGNVQDQIILLGPALAGLAGLDNVAAGVAQLVEVLAPIGRLGNPPQAPEDNVVDAIERVLAAIGPEQATIDAVPVPEAPVGFIGEPL